MEPSNDIEKTDTGIDSETLQDSRPPKLGSYDGSCSPGFLLGSIRLCSLRPLANTVRTVQDTRTPEFVNYSEGMKTAESFRTKFFRQILERVTAA